MARFSAARIPDGPFATAGRLRRGYKVRATGTIQKMIVENGSVTMDLDVSRLNGARSATQNLQAHFAVGANSFFPVLIFNDQLRGPLPGSMALIPAGNVQESACGPGRFFQAACQLKNFLRARGLILPCAIAIRDSRFSTFKDISTITRRRRSRLPSPMAGCSFQKSLPKRWVVRPTLIQSLERSPLAQ